MRMVESRTGPLADPPCIPGFVASGQTGRPIGQVPLTDRLGYVLADDLDRLFGREPRSHPDAPLRVGPSA